MCNEKNHDELEKLKAAKSIYKICIDTRNFEISQLIQRNNFFMLFQGVLFAAAMQAQSSKPIVEFVICALGVAVSFYQLQMSCGAKYWQEWWEDRLEYYENIIKSLKKECAKESFELFAVSETEVRERVSARLDSGRESKIINFLIKSRFSVTRAPIKVSLVLLLAWGLLTLHTLNLWCGDKNELVIRIGGFDVSQPSGPTSQ